MKNQEKRKAIRYDTKAGISVRYTRTSPAHFYPVPGR